MESGRGGGGLMVSDLAFYSNHLSLNPAGYLNFSVRKEVNKLRRGHLFMGSSGGKVVRATALQSKGPEFETTWRQGFFLFFFFSQWQSVLN